MYYIILCLWEVNSKLPTGGGGSVDLKTDYAERSNNRTLQILLITNSAGHKTQQLTVPDITKCTFIA